MKVIYNTGLYKNDDLNPGPLDCTSDRLPTELCGPLGITLIKNIYKPNDVSNDVIKFMSLKTIELSNNLTYFLEVPGF